MAAGALTHWYGEQYKNYHTASDTFMKGDASVIMKHQLQQLLHHFVPKFYYFKGFFITNACKKCFLRLQKFFQEMNEF